MKDFSAWENQIMSRFQNLGDNQWSSTLNMCHWEDELKHYLKKKMKRCQKNECPGGSIVPVIDSGLSKIVYLQYQVDCGSLHTTESIIISTKYPLRYRSVNNLPLATKAPAEMSLPESINEIV